MESRESWTLRPRDAFYRQHVEVGERVKLERRRAPFDFRIDNWGWLGYWAVVAFAGKFRDLQGIFSRLTRLRNARPQAAAELEKRFIDASVVR